MFHTKYRFDIMSEMEVENAIEAERRSESYFSLLENDKTWIDSQISAIDNQISVLVERRERLKYNNENKTSLLTAARQNLKDLFECLRKKQLERLAKAAAERELKGEKVKKSKEQQFEEALARVPKEKRYENDVDDWRILLGYD